MSDKIITKSTDFTTKPSKPAYPPSLSTTDENVAYQIIYAGLLHHLNGVKTSRVDPTKRVYFFDKVKDVTDVVRQYKGREIKT